MELCFIVDVNVAWMKRPLRRRGFLVYAPHEDYPPDASDNEILEYAEKTGCIVVSADKFFEGKKMAVYIPPSWEKKYNTWEIVTKVIKEASKIKK